jgi:hypothetical protein
MNKKQKQWAEKHDEFLKQILARLKCDESVFLPNYKSLYFRIFKEAYESGFCVPLSYNEVYLREEIRVEWIHTKPKISGVSIWHYAVEQDWRHPEMQGRRAI